MHREDPLKFWKFNRDQFPQLAKMACVELLSTASSAPSERIFSEAKNIELRKRYHMVEDTLSAYVLVRSGLRSEMMNFEMKND